MRGTFSRTYGVKVPFMRRGMEAVSSWTEQESVDLGKEVLPCGIVLRQEMVAAVEWDQAAVRYQRSQQPGLLEDVVRLPARAHDQCGHR
jgi:hypothetical protein